MKNIHVLPTDKPSRLHSGNSGLVLCDLKFNSDTINAQHIYITSNEEIKEGDWFIANNGVHKCIRVDNNTSCPFITLNSKGEEIGHFKTWKTKIILTTDQDLIKDGVQPIDDEFLEWFVKNPSCEWVEVKKESEFYRSGPLDLLGHSIITYKINIPEKITRCCGRCNGVDDLCYSDMTCDNHKERGCEICYGKRIEYKIIIPKEELNLNCFDCDKSLEDCTCIEDTIDMKETLEEAAENFVNSTKLRNYKVLFIEGAKWQQEQILQFLYSEITERRPYSSSKMCEKVIEFIEQLNTKK